MQVGGNADYLADPKTSAELEEVLMFARGAGLPTLVMGKGSNLIFPDEGFRGVVITMIHYEADRLEFDSASRRVTASAGIHLYRFACACRDRGFAGAEFLANIPGTVGGALVMNAGFSRVSGQMFQIGDLVRSVTVLEAPGGAIKVLAAQELAFTYRKSNLDGKIILSAEFGLREGSPEAIRAEMEAGVELRNRKQDLRYPSCGSVFKNPRPPFEPAARLIDELGLKGTRLGGAMVSDKHANYIVNTGGATASEVVQLIRKVQDAVYRQKGILLEPEVRVLEAS
jgi:UDP-N-acetylmuramate dehydrogenase